MIAFPGFPKGCGIVFTDQSTFSSPEFARDFFVTDQTNGNQLSRATQFYKVCGLSVLLCRSVELLHHFIDAGNPADRFNREFAVM